MATYIAFLRAVNVRPRWVKMETLRILLSGNGFRDVETYIQSGNVRVTTSLRSAGKVKATLEGLIEAEFGFPVPCILRTPAELSQIVHVVDGLPDPLPGGATRQYVTLYDAPPADEHAQRQVQWEVPGERLHPHGRETYWWLAKSTHEAKVSNAVLERGGSVATTRDLKVMRTLAAKWGA